MINEVTLLGRLGQDPQVKFTPQGSPYILFSLATGEEYIDKKGNKQDDTTWHRCQVWGSTAKAIEQYCKKGSLVFVKGKIVNRSWEDNGQKRYSTEIQVLTIKFCDPKKRDSAPPSPSDQDFRGEPSSFPQDNIPF